MQSTLTIRPSNLVPGQKVLLRSMHTPPYLSFALQGLTCMNNYYASPIGLCSSWVVPSLPPTRPYSLRRCQRPRPCPLRTSWLSSKQGIIPPMGICSPREAASTEGCHGTRPRASGRHRFHCPGQEGPQFTAAPVRWRPPGPMIGLLATSMEGMIHIG